MALSKKIAKAVKDTQKQAEATAADVREAFDARIADLNVDPTPLYAIVGAADLALDTVRHAGDQIDASRREVSTSGLRKGTKKEAAQLQKELKKRIAELQDRTAELQQLAAKFADNFVATAQDLPALVLNQGLVMAGNAREQYDAAAVRGEQVIADLRHQGDRMATDMTQRSERAMARGRKVAKTVAAEGEKVARVTGDVVQDDAGAIGAQVQKSVRAIDEAVAPEAPARRPARKAPTAARKTAGRKTAARKTGGASKQASGTVAARSTTTRKAAAKRGTKAASKKSGS